MVLFLSLYSLRIVPWERLTNICFRHRSFSLSPGDYRVANAWQVAMGSFIVALLLSRSATTVRHACYTNCFAYAVPIENNAATLPRISGSLRPQGYWLRGDTGRIRLQAISLTAFTTVNFRLTAGIGVPNFGCRSTALVVWRTRL